MTRFFSIFILLVFTGPLYAFPFCGYNGADPSTASACLSAVQQNFSDAYYASPLYSSFWGRYYYDILSSSGDSISSWVSDIPQSGNPPASPVGPTCPPGQSPASSQSQLNTTIDTCVPDGVQSCSSIGFDVNAFVPACQGTLPGHPSQCVNSDLNVIQIGACPSIQCSDGSTVQFPDTCPPVVNCPGGSVIDGVCVKDDPNDSNCFKFGGKLVCSGDAKNCVYDNGHMLCLNPQATNCGTVNGKQVCVDSAASVTKEVSSVVTNSDGSTTTTSQVSSNVKNVNNYTTTETHYTDGRTIVQSTNVTPQSNSAALAAIARNTSITASNTESIKLDARKISDSIDKAFKDDGSFSSKASSSLSSIDSDLEAKKTALDNDLKNFTNPLADKAGFSVSDWLPSLPSPTCYGTLSTTIFGRAFVIDPCDKFQILRDVLAFFFYITTLFICIRIFLGK